MLRNILAAALRNLARNRLYAAISIAGLAVALAAAILTGLYIRDELTFERFIPGYRSVYTVISDIEPPGRARLLSDMAHSGIAKPMALEFPDLPVARSVETFTSVRRGETETSEKLAWVDPAFFDIVRLPAVSGDPSATVHRPDGLVLTEAMARKFFGDADPIGQTLEIGRAMPMKVGAVLKDIPANSSFYQGIYGSGLHPTSGMSRTDSQNIPRGAVPTIVRIFIRDARPGAVARIDAALLSITRRHLAMPDGSFFGGTKVVWRVIPLSELHLFPISQGMSINLSGQGDPALLVALATIAGLILVMAGINFVNLMTARSSQRMVEVGVRKLAGAERKHLIAQFIGEAVIYALLGLLLAVALVELALPPFRALLERPMPFAYWRDPALSGAAIGTSLILGLLAGVYPALVQSSFRPAVVLKGGLPQGLRGLAVREGLVISQFAVLIGLILATGVVTYQTHYVMNEGLRLDKDQMLVLDTSQPPDLTKTVAAPRRILCREPFIEKVRALPGVRGVSCSSPNAMGLSENPFLGIGPNHQIVTLSTSPFDFGFLELYGMKPVAGRTFSQPSDTIPNVRPLPPPRVVILNQRAVQALGFKSADEAVAKGMLWEDNQKGHLPLQVIGVIPNFDFNALLGSEPRPIISYLPVSSLTLMHVKLKGGSIPQTIRSIDGLWRQTGFQRPVRYRFVDDYLQEIYSGVLRQGVLIDVLCGIAVVIGCLGLFGLAAFTAERRTKEIGVRKVMGASKADVMKLLLWSFTRPVLWANLIAWPAGWWALSRWLRGFSTRIELSPLFFLAAGAAALLIAAVTVSAHAFKIARARPVGALRYE